MNKKVISSTIFKYARLNPGKQAIVMPDGSGATYSDLVNAYVQQENFLRDLNIQPSDRMALISSDNLALAMLTLPLIERAVAVPLDSDYPEKKLSELLTMAKVSFIITDSSNSTAVRVAKSQGLGLIIFRKVGVTGSLGFVFELLNHPRSGALEKGFKCSDISLILTTSGTTDEPKNVPTKYESIANVLHEMAEHYQYDENVYTLALVKLSMFISFNNVLRVLLRGGRVMLAVGVNFSELIDILSKDKITNFTSSPAFFRSFVDHIEKQLTVIKPASLKYVCCAGAVLTESLRKRIETALGVPVYPYYGMTEALAITSSFKNTGGIKNGSVGVSVGAEVRIENGEILVRSNKVFPGYETMTGLDRSSFSGDWFHTGDLGCFDEAGNLYVTGRIKEMINRGGEKVSPYEVEAVIDNIPEVKEAAVFPWNSVDGFEEVGAAVVFESGAEVSLKQIRKYLAGNISSYKMPTLLYSVKSIPKGSMGKIDRKGLYRSLNREHEGESLKPKKQLAGQDVERLWKDHTVDLATRIKLLWVIVINLDYDETIELDDNFFDLGGDSLAAMAMLSAIDDQFGIQVPLIDFYRQPTINTLVGIINNSSPLKELSFKHLVPLTLNGRGAPLFCVHPLSGEVANNRFLAEYVEGRPVYGLKFEKLDKQGKGPLGVTEIARSYLHEVVQVWPEGPYLFCGTCLGAVIAAEMALQLREQGKKVDFIAFFDPIVSKTKRTVTTKARRNFYERAMKAIKELKDLKAANLTGFIGRKTRNLFKLAKREGEEIRYELTGADSGRDFSKKEILLVAARTYKRRLVSGKVYYFQPTAKSIRSDRAIEGWKDHLGDLVMIPVPGNHISMQQREGMSFIAKEINIILKNQGL